MSYSRISQYVPTVTRAKDGHLTIDWHTPTGDMPRDGAIVVNPEMVAEWVRTANALVDAEILLGVRQ